MGAVHQSLGGREYKVREVPKQQVMALQGGQMLRGKGGPGLGRAGNGWAGEEGRALAGMEKRAGEKVVELEAAKLESTQRGSQGKGAGVLPAGGKRRRGWYMLQPRPLAGRLKGWGPAWRQDAERRLAGWLAVRNNRGRAPAQRGEMCSGEECGLVVWGLAGRALGVRQVSKDK